MNFILDLINKRSYIIFSVALLINLIITSLIYSIKFYPAQVEEFTKISDFVVKKFEEKDIQISIKNEEIVLGKDSYIVESEGFPISLNPKNMIYIAKNADYSAFKEKDTIAILNDKELVLNINNDYQNFPLKSLLANNSELIINSSTVKDFLNKNYLDNNKARNLLYGGFMLDRALNYIALFIWAYLILGFSLFFLFKFSGFIIEKKFCQKASLLVYSVFLVVQSGFYYFGKEPNLIYVFLFGLLALSFYIKYTVDNAPKA